MEIKNITKETTVIPMLFFQFLILTPASVLFLIVEGREFYLDSKLQSLRQQKT